MLAETAGTTTVRSLTDRQYRQLRLGAETYRQELVLRLGAEVGLRPVEMVEITPGSVTTWERNGVEHHFLSVPGSGDGSARKAYLPADVHHDLEQYVRAEDIDSDERLVPVTPRRVQMLITEVTDRAASRTGDEQLSEVSSRTLRRYFARRLLEAEDVHPKIVQEIGGWDRLASLEPYLSEPTTEDVAAAFERTSLGSRGGHDLSPEAFAAVVEQLDRAVYVTDPTGEIQYVNEAFESMTGYAASEALGETPAMFVSEDSPDGGNCLEHLLAGETWTGTVESEIKDGGTCTADVTVTPVTTADGTEYFVAVARERDGTVATRVPSRFDAVLEHVRAVSDVLSSVSMRGEIEQQTCERLAAGDAYEFAWAGKRSGDELTTCASAGIDAGTVADLAAATEASSRALREGEVYTTTEVTTDPLFEPWADHAREEGYNAAAAIPVVDGDTTYGVLHLAASGQDVFTERECTMLADLGERIGQALTAAERRKLLLADTVVELEFKTTDRSSFFARAAAEFDCTFELEGVVPGGEQSLLYFVVLEDADPEAVLQWASDQGGVSDVRLVRDYGDWALLEFVVADGECSKLVAEQGGDLGSMTVEDGIQRFTGVMPSDSDVRETVYTLTEAFPGTELLTKREREKRTNRSVASRSSFEETLTEKQAAVVEAAHHAGYFEWPRGSTAEELADSMGITSPTLHNHLRRGLQKLLVAFLDEQDTRPRNADTPWEND